MTQKRWDNARAVVRGGGLADEGLNIEKDPPGPNVRLTLQGEVLANGDREGECKQDEDCTAGVSLDASKVAKAS